MYVRTRLDKGLSGDLQPFRFVCEGSFSVVAGGDLAGEHTVRMLLEIRRYIEEALGLQLRYV